MLRTDLFKTNDRVDTKYIAVRDTLTKSDANIDALMIDAMHCKRGSLGIGYHFLILTSGTIQLCRDIETVGSHTKDVDPLCVAIGIVGGTDHEGERINTRTPDQLESLKDMLEFLSARYPTAEVSDRPEGN